MTPEQELELQKKFENAKEDMHSGTQERVIKARDRFAALGDYKSSAAMVRKCQMLLEFQVGNKVTFGSYNGTPIRWKVCDTNGKMRMLIADQIVLEKPYNDLRIDTYWQTTSLRKWLNKEFLQEAFSQEERTAVIATRRTNEANRQFFTNAGLPTMDKVFVLSHQELERYLPNQEDRTLGKWWWLRTPGDNLLAVEAVDPEGEVYLHGANVNYAAGGVRPAMWVLLKDF